MFVPLNPLLHSELRLAVMSLLVSVEEADFMDILEQTESTPGNLSVQIEKLKKAGYIDVTKSFKANRPCTNCKITKKGLDAFDEYVNALQKYILK
ncbi:hypothetical protein SDC9_64940 [bioreactor metagenome]|uniref:Winged helix DNA-binding domain-containing protein n=1 Tax=bioreactor metagenome TaxID=1076179 RepID=A0A644XRZ6_9ZZZZ